MFLHRPARHSIYRTLSIGLALLAALGGLSALCGHVFGVEPLRVVFPGGRSSGVGPLSALGLVLLGVGSAALYGESLALRWIGRLCGGIVASVALLVLQAQLTGLGDDTFRELLPGPLGARRTPVNALLNFALLGSAICLIDFPRREIKRLGGSAIATAAWISLLSVVGYMYGVQPMVASGADGAVMAVNEAVLFFAVCVSAVFSRPERGFMKLFTSDSAAGLVMRRLLPTALGVQFLMAYLQARGEEAGIFGREIGPAVLTLGNVAALFVLILWCAWVLFRIEQDRKKTESDLLLAEQKYRTIFDNSAAAITVCDGQERIISWNRFAEDLFGMSKEDLYLRPVSSLYSEEEWRRIRSQNVREKGMQHHLETRIQRKNGQALDIDISITVLKDAQGQITGSIGIIRDITDRKKVEAEQSRLAAIVGASHDAILTIDLKGTILTWNAGAQRIYQYTEREIAGQSVMLLIPPERRVELPSIIERASAGEEISQFETVRVRKDGQPIHVSLSISPVRGIDGTVHTIAVIARDITDRKLVERALMENERQFKSLVSNIPGVLYRCRCDPYWTMEYLSPAIERLCGYQASDFIGNGVRAYSSIIHPDDADMVDGFILKAVRTRQPYSIEYRILHRDGGVRWVYEKGRASYREDGEVLYRDGAIMDVSERRAAQEALLESEERYRSVITTMAEGVVLLNADGQVQAANASAAQILGVAIERMVGERFPESSIRAFEEDGTALDWATFPTRLTLEEGRPVLNRILRLAREDGNDQWVSINTQPIQRPGQTQASAVVMSLHDITQRKLAEQRMAEAVEMKSEFTSIVSHELRTPLSVIKEAVAIVAEGMAGPLNKQQSDFLSTAKRNIDRLARLINDVLDFQKLEAMKIKFRFEKNDLNELVREVAAGFELTTKAKGLTIETRLHAGLEQLSFDRDRITQVLSNLINNAVKFTEKGRILLETRPEGRAVRVCVQDEGGGIKTEDLNKLFKSFSQLSNGSRKTGGTGLGLAISKKIVDAHRGEIGVISDYGRGSTFYFTLPLEQAVEGAHVA
ncbi:MAG: Adaptive-response sensory-kinase SasA [Candidatus Omnitrophica bacterium]|nr:Adaptive-response sensory-kinase SasA [Candidatus Omnitrophota bacterium]